MHQAEVAFLNQVEQRQARGLVLLRDRHDEAKVGLHEGALGFVARANRATEFALARRGQVLGLGRFLLGTRGDAGLDGLRQPNLVVFGEQRILPNISEVQADKVFLVTLYSFLRHAKPF